MNDELERVFDEALDLLEQGAGIDAIIARYPAQAADLRPFLLTASRLSRLATQPGLSAEVQSKRAFLAAAAAPATVRRSAGVGRLSRLAAGLVALLVVFLLSGSVLVGASASAAPGSPLYGTKRLVENVRLALASDPERAAVLRERFRRERLAEVAQLLAAGREAEVTLTGVIDAIDDYGWGGAHWTVDELPVVVDEQTVVDGRPAVGALVEIDGRTAGDAVRATRVTVLSAGLPEPTPAPNITPDATTPAATPTPAATDDEAMAAPGAAPLATASPSPTASPTPSPSPSPSPTPPPTLSPAPTDDNANDNDVDDNANDNGGDDNSNDNDDNANDNGGDDNSNDNDDNANDNGGDDNSNDNGDNENANDNDDNSNDNGDDNSNDNDDNANDNSGDDNDNDDNANDNGDDNSGSGNNDNNSGSGGGDNDNDDNSGSGGGDNDNGGGDDDEGD